MDLQVITWYIGTSTNKLQNQTLDPSINQKA